MTTGGRILRAFLFIVAVAWVRSVAARVVINELYYDHPGTDTGHEFVELINTGALPADLSGTSIEFHNGTGTTWALVWRAPPGTMLVPGGIFLVGGDLVTPAPDAVITYALQNGPDSIRLITFDGAVLDVLGYGGLDDPAFVEGLGAPPVPAGKSVARVLDGVDGDDNSIDFAAASPTPGRHNVARDDAALVLAPETPVRAAKTRPGAERVVVRVENRGLAPIAAGDVELLLSDSTVAGVVRLAAGRNAADIAPGRGERVVVSAVLDGGYHWLEVSARYARDERDDNDRVRVLRRVGRVPVLVSEVWSSPRAGCPQFVELVNVGSEPVQVGGFALRDERARPVVIDADSLCLSPGAWLAVTADVARLSECVPRAPRDGVIGVRGAWPTFNRSGGDVADSVLVFDREGIVVDAVAYPAVPSASAGRSLERIDLFLHDNPAVWRLSDAPGGASPAAANRAYLDRPAPAGDVVVSPNPFFPARGDLLRVAMTPAPVVARVDAWVYDLDGRRVAALGGVASFPALLVWDGRGADGAPARPGIYVVAVEMLGVDGARLGVERVVVGCARASLP